MRLKGVGIRLKEKRVGGGELGFCKSNKVAMINRDSG